MDKHIPGNSSHTDFSNQDLSGADLSKRSFVESDFSGANLTNADMRWSKLHDADLTGANVEGVNFKYASFKNPKTDCHETVGLVACDVRMAQPKTR
jgi:uncharacterized protein YjbI with pentapeptide repeats